MRRCSQTVPVSVDRPLSWIVLLALITPFRGPRHCGRGREARVSKYIAQTKHRTRAHARPMRDAPGPRLARRRPPQSAQSACVAAAPYVYASMGVKTNVSAKTGAISFTFADEIVQIIEMPADCEVPVRFCPRKMKATHLDGWIAAVPPPVERRHLTTIRRISNISRSAIVGKLLACARVILHLLLFCLHSLIVLAASSWPQHFHKSTSTICSVLLTTNVAIHHVRQLAMFPSARICVSNHLVPSLLAPFSLCRSIPKKEVISPMVVLMVASESRSRCPSSARAAPRAFISPKPPRWAHRRPLAEQHAPRRSRRRRS